MTRPVCIQVYVSREQSARIREAARARELDVSTWVRSLLAAACDDADPAWRPDGVDGRIARQSVFVMVASMRCSRGIPTARCASARTRHTLASAESSASARLPKREVTHEA